MIAQYIEKAMARARVERTEDGQYIASITGFQGPWACGDTQEEARAELRSVFEEWLVAALREDDELPELDGVSLNFGGKRWQKQRVAER